MNKSKKVSKAKKALVQIHLALDFSNPEDLAIIKDMGRRKEQNKTLKLSNAMIARQMMIEATLPF